MTDTREIRDGTVSTARDCRWPSRTATLMVTPGQYQDTGTDVHVSARGSHHADNASAPRSSTYGEDHRLPVSVHARGNGRTGSWTSSRPGPESRKICRR